jgi:hypothetical protein
MDVRLVDLITCVKLLHDGISCSSNDNDKKFKKIKNLKKYLEYDSALWH